MYEPLLVLNYISSAHEALGDEAAKRKVSCN
jgi:hypothetical protein